ncbi:hypothetical protein N7G274_006458 [Stereocaulon virgatum]|uniref:Uncharacterized protein n=1 Tax=Stereocaulon virgatum TaxID=373712 RepID=A0ABR4A597_9LECA
MAKRNSITGVRRKRAKPAAAKASAIRPTVEVPTLHDFPGLDTASKPRELLSTRRLPQPASRNRVPNQPTLKPRVKHISQNTIRTRWTVLDEDAQAKVAAIFHAIELPVLARHASEQKKVEAQAILASVTRTLTKRIPKMPFPPKTKEIHFDYEALVKSNRNLHQRLTASTKANAELRDEVEKHKLALASEQQELEKLQGNG